MQTITKTEFKTFFSFFIFVFSGIGAYIAMIDSPEKQNLATALLIFQILGFSVFYYWLIFESCEIIKWLKTYGE